MNLIHVALIVSGLEIMSEYDIYVSTIFIKTKLDLSNCTPNGRGRGGTKRKVTRR